MALFKIDEANESVMNEKIYSLDPSYLGNARTKTTARRDRKYLSQIVTSHYLVRTAFIPATTAACRCST